MDPFFALMAILFLCGHIKAWHDRHRRAAP